MVLNDQNMMHCVLIIAILQFWHCNVTLKIQHIHEIICQFARKLILSKFSVRPVAVLLDCSELELGRNLGQRKVLVGLEQILWKWCSADILKMVMRKQTLGFGSNMMMQGGRWQITTTENLIFEDEIWFRMQQKVCCFHSGSRGRQSRSVQKQAGSLQVIIAVYM